MADVKFEVTRFALSTAAAGNTQDVTISGFGTPKAAIFILNGATANDTVTAHVRSCVGFTDGTRNYVHSGVSEDAQAFTDCGHRLDSAVIVSSPVSGISVDLQFSFNSWITDGVRLDIDNASPSAFFATCILIGGADVTNAHCNLVNLSGTVDVTQPGFEPSVVFLAPTSRDFAGDSATDFRTTLGVAVNDGADTQASGNLYCNDGDSTSNVRAALNNTYTITHIQATGGFVYTGQITTFDANGFTITISGGGSAGHDVPYLCLKFNAGVHFGIEQIAIPTSGDYSNTSLGFRPEFGLFRLMLDVPDRTSLASSSLGTDGSYVKTSAAEYMNEVKIQDSVGTTVCKSRSSDSFKMIDYNSANDEIVASSVDITGYGWDITLSTNPASEMLGWALAIGGYWNNTVAAEKSPGKVTGVSGKVLANVMGVA
jgi:hypothetical protein